MAVRAIEGFEVNGSATALAELYEAVFFDDGDVFRDGYQGGVALQSAAGVEMTRFTVSLGASHNELIVGFRICAVAPKDGTQLFILWRDLGGSAKVWLQIRRISPLSPDYVIELQNGDPSAIATTPLIKGEPWAWAYVELRIVVGTLVSAPLGAFELRLDTTVVASGEANTEAQGVHSSANRCEFRLLADEDWEGDEASFVALDDVYIVNVPASPGDEVADFLGAPVMREMPVAEDAGTNDWDPHGAVTHAACVADDADHDGDATYLEAPGDSVEEHFRHAPAPDEIGDVVHALKLQTVARLDAAGSEDMAQLFRIDGGAYASSTYPVNSTGYKRREQIRDTDPSIGGRFLLERVEEELETGFVSQ